MFVALCFVAIALAGVAMILANGSFRTQAEMNSKFTVWAGFELLPPRDAAVKEKTVRLEFALVEAACNIFSAPELPPAVDMPGMTAERALTLLQMYKSPKRLTGRHKRPPCLPSVEEVKAEILQGRRDPRGAGHGPGGARGGPGGLGPSTGLGRTGGA